MYNAYQSWKVTREKADRRAVHVTNRLNKTAANPLFPPIGALWGNLRGSKNGANVKTMRIGILGAFALTLFSCYGERLPTVTLETDKGNIVIELYPEAAPATVANFAKLIEAEFYNGLKFHRYVPGFVIQGGDPEGTGRGGPGWTIRGEFQDPGLREKMPPHEKGVLAMARTRNPNSAGSQFYICLGTDATRYVHLNGDYTTFGRVIKGMDVVDALRRGDVMRKVTLENYTASP